MKKNCISLCVFVMNFDSNHNECILKESGRNIYSPNQCRIWASLPIPTLSLKTVHASLFNPNLKILIL
jgi:hypothetical protein